MGRGADFTKEEPVSTVHSRRGNANERGSLAGVSEPLISKWVGGGVQTRHPLLLEAAPKVGGLPSPPAHFSPDVPLAHPDAQPSGSLYNCPAPGLFPASAQKPRALLCHGWVCSGSVSRPLSGPYVRSATPRSKGRLRYTRVCMNLCAPTRLSIRLRPPRVPAFAHICEFVGIRAVSRRP